MSFYYGRKICIFSKGLTQDSCQKFQLSLAPTSVFSFDDVVLSKGGFLDNKNVNACERLEVSEHIRKHTQVCLDLNPFLYR